MLADGRGDELGYECDWIVQKVVLWQAVLGAIEEGEGEKREGLSGFFRVSRRHKN